MVWIGKYLPEVEEDLLIMVNSFNEAKCILQGCHKTLVYSGCGSVTTAAHLAANAVVAAAIPISAAVVTAQGGASAAIIASIEAIVVVAEVVVRVTV